MLVINGLSIKFNYLLIEKSNLVLKNGQMISLIGPSGSGKTSILNAISNVDTRKLDQYIYNDIDLTKLNHQEINEFRYNHIFYIKQDYTFLSSLTCFNHFKLMQPKYTKKDILNILSMVSLEIEENIYPEQLSTGQKQRFCLAMALASGADIILCDELTASLDSVNRDKLLNTLTYLTKKEGKTIVLSTHDEEVVNRCETVYEIKDNHVIEIKKKELIDNNSEQSKKRVFPSIFQMLKCQLLSMKHRFGNSQLYCIFMIIVILACGLGFVFGTQETINNNYIYSLLGKDQYYLTNKYVPENKSSYSEENPPFSDDFISRLNQEPTFEAIYPYYQLPMNARYKDTNGKRIDTLVNEYKIKINDNEISINRNQQMYTIPYYDQDYMNKRCRGKTSDTNGVYLNLDAALALGIESIEQPTTIEYTVLIPVDRVAGVFEYANNAGNFENVEGLKETLYKEYTIKLPVAGLLDMYFTSYGGSNNIYVPFDYLNNILEQESSQYQYNTYVAYVSDTFNQDEFTKTMTNENSHLDVFNLRNYFEDIDYSILNTEKMIIIGDGLLIVTVITLSFVYGLYLYKQNKVDKEILEDYGYSVKQQRKYMIASILNLNLVIGIGALLFGNAVYYLLRLGRYIYSSYQHQAIYFVSLIIIIGLSVLLPWISYLPTLLKKAKPND